MSGEVFTGEVLSGIIDTGSSIFGSNLFSSSSSMYSPSAFWSWLFGVLKTFGLWLLSNWYWFVGFIIVYVLFIVSYHLVWGKVVVYFQKKGYEKYKLENGF